MPFTRSTELGRRVIMDDWIGFHRDRLLCVLYDMRESGRDFNGLTSQQICNVTGLDQDHVAQLIHTMSALPGLIQFDMSLDMWLITSRGVRWVEESPKTRP